PPAVAAAAARGIQLVTAEPDRRRELAVRAAAFRARLAGARLDTGSAEAQIVPVVVGAPATAVTVAEALAAEGFFVPAIRPPSVPAGMSLVRASVCWHHTAEDLDRLAAALARHAAS
ncbi:MAG: aminotransferase class I/II-fold pyridoxal phosphate-dependent enzyme, partial [Planctomycetia bacterium]